MFYEWTCSKIRKDDRIPADGRNVIYYFVDYYPNFVKDSDPFTRDRHEMVLNLKPLDQARGKQNYPAAQNPWYFRACVDSFIEKLTHYNYEDWLIGSIPGHAQMGSAEGNSIDKLLYFCKLGNRVTFVRSMITRRYVVLAKHSNQGERSSKDDLDSLVIKPTLSVKYGKIIVVDDITTTGSSFDGVKKALMDAGASKVLCLAMAKTKDRYNGWQ
jgi:hypothetical protein